jgi:hypothetical protein
MSDGSHDVHHRPDDSAKAIHMTLDDYFDEWQKDAPIPPDDLDKSSRDVPLLHAKWWRFYASERLHFRKVEMEGKTLYNHLYQWYAGKMIDEDRLKLGWPTNPLKVLPAGISRHIDADTRMQDLVRRKVLLEETLRFLEDVVAQINKRGFHISNAVNFLKFKMGV